eukprot:376178-Rhodomonas_salina.1
MMFADDLFICRRTSGMKRKLGRSGERKQHGRQRTLAWKTTVIERFVQRAGTEIGGTSAEPGKGFRSGTYPRKVCDDNVRKRCSFFGVC